MKVWMLAAAAAAALCLPASLSANCYGNCTHLTVDHGYLVGAGGGGSGPVWVGTNWSSIARLLAERMPNVGALPGMDANASTMRQLTLSGDYLADVPLVLPSRRSAITDATSARRPGSSSSTTRR